MNIVSSSNNFVATINNVDLSKISQETVSHLKEILYKYKVICIKGQNLDEKKYIDFAKKIGKIVEFPEQSYHHPEYPEIFVTSNVEKDGKKIGMNRVGYYWHSDSSFLPTPLPLTMLYAQLVPSEGGETAFIDMNDVYGGLSSEIQDKLEGQYAVHEGKWRYIILESDLGLSVQEILERDESLSPASVHPTIIVHPVTKEKKLYVNEGFTKKLIGLGAESDIILNEIFNKTKNNLNIYTHKWSVGDIVIWDNRSVVHKASASANGEARMMFRIGIEDGDFY